MVPPQVRIYLDIEVVLHICDADENRCADEAIHKAARHRSICKAAGEHRDGWDWRQGRPDVLYGDY